ncbi:MAG: D-lactate dehydrogenase [Verrucomicrobiota bacterium]|nr:D-lactate dehydrogenase [Verrucomicrobiota bacterium]|tara:strand:+ start:1693 stop:3396 length:1704 start_codon:yes stop_codon:yes gene_type:complete
MTGSEIIEQLKSVVGHKGVLSSKSKTAYYRSGFRSGFGGSVGVVFPKSLIELWETLKVCVDANCAIIMQATKTGLTEGSSPSGFDYDREVVIINITRIKKIILLDGGKQVIAFPGSTLHELEGELSSIKRAPHSVIGSTTIGATIVGGIANNAGGALCKRGSSYTELSLYARVNKEGNLELINHLGIENLGETPEEIFENLEKGSFSKEDIQGMDKAASDREYQNRIRNIDAEIPNRYNADPNRLYEVSGSAGKVVAFAVRVDTYPMPKEKKVFYLGTNNPNDFSKLRKDILKNFSELPEMCEYMNREIFDTAKKYGKDVFLSIKHIGTKRLPKLYAIKSNMEYYLNKIPLVPKFLPDQILYYLSRLFPEHLPKRLIDYRNQYEHYLILDMSDEGIEEARKYLEKEWSSLDGVGFFECNEDEQKSALMHRFAAAGAAIRYQTIHQRKTEEVLALDIALLGNDTEWMEKIPDEIKEDLDLSLYYGHFMCHVFHHDYILKKGTNIKDVKENLLKRLDQKSAKYPAEHNVGHMYKADETLQKHYRELDPTNTFNPGIGFTDKKSTRTNAC